MTNGTIRLRRIPKLWNSRGERFRVAVDGRDMTKISNDGVVELEIVPGTHHLTVRGFGTKGSIDVDVLANATVTLCCEATLSFSEGIRIWHEGPNSKAIRAHDSQGQLRAPSYSLIETHRTEEQVGVDYRTVENPSRGTSVTRSLRISREWTRSWSVGFDETSSSRRTGHLGPEWVRIQSDVGAEIKRMYSISSEQREEYSEEVTLQIGPQSAVRLAISWKRIWQHGHAVDRTQANNLEIPFKVVTAITFDQILSDA